MSVAVNAPRWLARVPGHFEGPRGRVDGWLRSDGSITGRQSEAHMAETRAELGELPNPRGVTWEAYELRPTRVDPRVLSGRERVIANRKARRRQANAEPTVQGYIGERRRRRR